MAVTKFYIKNPCVLVKTTDVSAYVKQVTVTLHKDELDTTASGDAGHTQIPGFSKDTIALDLYQDKDFTVLDEILWEIYADEQAVALEVTPSGSTLSESNPGWEGNGKLYDYVPLKEAVGAVAMVSPTFTIDGKLNRIGT
jgi:hypothetical protein